MCILLWQLIVEIIRVSVDALCRDGTSEISRDPRTKRLKTRREWLTMASKSLAIVYRPIPSYTYAPRLHTCPQFPTREVALTRFHDFRVIIIIIILFFFLFRPASSVPEAVEALIFSQNVSNFAGGMHGYQAIVSFLSQVTTVYGWTLPQLHMIELFLPHRLSLQHIDEHQSEWCHKPLQK